MKEARGLIKVSQTYNNKIQSFCNPLIQTFGITHFYHAKITNDGHFVAINLNRDWEEYFFSNRSHLLIWPDKCSPQQIKSGIRFLNDDKHEKESLNFLLKTARDSYSLNFSLQFVEKSNWGFEMWGFALNTPNSLQHMHLVKEAPLLRLFIKRFQEEFKKLYLLLNENRVDLTDLLGPQFYEAKNQTESLPFAHTQFLKSIGVPLPTTLSNREVEVIKSLIRGYSASEIASQLFISRRTVEHHLERIKDKFSSASKSELIQKIRDLESIGYFMF